MVAKHGGSATVDHETGDAYVTHPHTLHRTKVDHVEVPNRPATRDSEQGGRGPAKINLSNRDGHGSAYYAASPTTEPDTSADEWTEAERELYGL